MPLFRRFSFRSLFSLRDFSFFSRFSFLRRRRRRRSSALEAAESLALSDEEVLERVMGKTLAAMRLSRAALPHMRKSGGGRIVCIGGTAARTPAKTSLPSGLGNSALANFAKHLSNDVGPENITVNVVHPSFTKTDRYPDRLKARAKEMGVSLEAAEASFAANFPIGRIVEPSDIAPMVLFLASPGAAAVTGQTIAVDGGSSQLVVY